MQDKMKKALIFFVISEIGKQPKETIFYYKGYVMRLVLMFKIIVFWPFCLYLIVTAEERQERRGRERGDDIQQLAQGWNQIRPAATRTRLTKMEDHCVISLLKAFKNN